MARTESTQSLTLGTPAPAFTLPEPATGRSVGLDAFAGKPVVIAFISNHCPFVKHLRSALQAFIAESGKQGVATILIGANDVKQYPEDGPAAIVTEAAFYGADHLHDPTQAVAKAYRAACTPDFFLFAGDHRLVYRGQFDGSRPGNGKPIDGADLRAAVTGVLAGKPPVQTQRPSMGCNIKWIPGGEPDYYR